MTGPDQKWQPGMQVRLIHNPLRIGMLTDAKPKVRKNRKLYKVRFPDQVDRLSFPLELGQVLVRFGSGFKVDGVWLGSGFRMRMF